MAIQRQAENPAHSLPIDQPFRYSIKPTKKRTSPVTPQITPAHTLESLRKDLIYTIVVFGAILAVIIGLYFKMR